MNSPTFYDAIRSHLFKGHLAQSQVDGVEVITSACLTYGVTDQRMVAYILATAYWETGQTMRPIEEYGKGAGHRYGGKIKQSGKPYTTPDQIYYGRGYTQNTWYENYEMLSRELYAVAKGWDFLNNPELLLIPEPSIWATIHCMWHGLYTGVSLSTYFTSLKEDWGSARKIINGMDQADKIAGFALIFYRALTAETSN